MATVFCDIELRGYLYLNGSVADGNCFFKKQVIDGYLHVDRMARMQFQLFCLILEISKYSVVLLPVFD